jgi:hypothetical protein
MEVFGSIIDSNQMHTFTSRISFPDELRPLFLDDDIISPILNFHVEPRVLGFANGVLRVYIVHTELTICILLFPNFHESFPFDLRDLYAIGTWHIEGHNRSTLKS